MPYLFNVVGDAGENQDLDALAVILRGQIPSSGPQLFAQALTTQAGVKAALSVVLGSEDPHTHPSDLIFSVLEGGGRVHLDDAVVIEAPAGTTVVIPRDTCHAFQNTSQPDVSVLLAMFAPADSGKPSCAFY